MTALRLEALPIAAMATFAGAVLLIGALDHAGPDAVQITAGVALFLVVMLSFLASIVSGLGWIEAGHPGVGITLMFGRFLNGVIVLGMALESDADRSVVAGVITIAIFAATPAVSTGALWWLVRDRRARDGAAAPV